VANQRAQPLDPVDLGFLCLSLFDDGPAHFFLTQVENRNAATPVSQESFSIVNR
jgi:hypothetical protein